MTAAYFDATTEEPPRTIIFPARIVPDQPDRKLIVSQNGHGLVLAIEAGREGPRLVWPLDAIDLAALKDFIEGIE